ncbi:MAG: hypothetical protein EOO29_34875, partial [Comamonadaceae bacterium]
MSTSPPVLLPWPRPRPSWRALVLLTAAVALVHLFLLGWLPMSGTQEELPLAHRFSTRTIVIAPPPMKLATLKDGSRDGQLVVVSRDLSHA